MKTMYQIQDREAGNIIEDNLTLEEAKKILKDFEKEDKKDNTYSEDFYEIMKTKTMKTLKTDKMKASKWYLVQGETQFGNYAIIKEEDTDLIVSEFPAVKHHTANERLINLKSIVDEHNKVVKLLKNQLA